MSVKQIVADFDRTMRAAYRRLRVNARALDRVLVYDPDPKGFALELVHRSDLDNADYMRHRTVLYDPQTKG